MLTSEVKAADGVDKLREKNVVVKDADAGTLVDYQQLVEAIGDAVIICDSDGVIRWWNSAAQRLFGFTPAEALGSSLDIVIPERLRERHWAGFARTMAAGQTRYAHDVLRVPAMHKDGRALSIAFTVGLLLGSQRKVTGLVAVIRDETKRFAEERDLRKRLAELESKNRACATNCTEGQNFTPSWRRGNLCLQLLKRNH